MTDNTQQQQQQVSSTPSISTTSTPIKTTQSSQELNKLATIKETLLPQTQQSQTKINRRRKTTSSEFDVALSNLRQHSMELNEACDRASKLTELSSRSVNSF